MKATTTVQGGITVISFMGKITIGDGGMALRSAVANALDAGSRKLVVNMGGVIAMDSSGVGELVTAYTSTTNRGGKLKLANLPAKITDILQEMRVLSVFDVFDSLDEALQSFD